VRDGADFTAATHAEPRYAQRAPDFPGGESPLSNPPAIALHPSERHAHRAAARPARLRAWRQAALTAAPIVAGIGVSAHAALRMMTPESVAPVKTPAVSAQVIVATKDDPTPETASPAIGTTGTAELPPEPAAIPAPVQFDTSITAAQPFSTARATALDRGRALECLTAAIYYEAASEPDDGQRAVAQVVLNRARHPAFPGTVCGVVYQGSERTSGCQFSFACDGAMARIPSRSGWSRALRNASAALAGQVFAPVGLATHYHTYAVTPAWNRALVMTDAIGAHFFHRWKGYWGTASAFHQAYRGGEPLPGPHPRKTIAAPVMALAAAPAVAIPVTPITQVQPAHENSGTATTAAPESQILDRWKDSGKPLR